jgi:hypothetical protein
MTLVLALALVVVCWLARPRPLLPRDRRDHVSTRWLRDHFYSDGKQS